MWPAGIRKVDDMPASRPSRYCLALQDDSVFADFDTDERGRVYLLRISFDGFGCCDTSAASHMSADTSARFVRLLENGGIKTQELASILENYFRENEGVVWKDALKEHGLLTSIDPACQKS